jgi:hypothetical protein
MSGHFAFAMAREECLSSETFVLLRHGRSRLMVLKLVTKEDWLRGM